MKTVNRKLIICGVLLLLLIIFVGCHPETVETRHLRLYGEFSFEEVKNSLDLNGPNVKKEGFVNVNEVDRMDFLIACERAELELDGDFDEYTVSYDRVEDVWMVRYSHVEGLTSWGGEGYRRSSSGVDETVYLNGNGVTLLIVYGG